MLCDTNGGSLPLDVREAVDAVRERLPDVALGIHTHDDTGCGVANTLVAVQAGATQVQGTINGIGERTGNANLVTIIADLQLKLGYEVLPPERLARLTETAHLVDELLNRTPDPAQPYVGKHAFAHKAGMHAAGVSAVERDVRARRSGAGRQSQRRADLRAVGAGHDRREGARGGDRTPTRSSRGRVVERVKELEHEGYQFEAADGSFELLMRREAGEYEPLFKLESWRVIVEQHADGRATTEATIKIWVGSERYVRTAEGNGPVHALDRALRDAIGEIHPHLKDIELVNFKVRILDETKGTGAVTRVLIDASDGHDVWGSIGVSENLIAASWDALVDSLERGMQGGRPSSVVEPPTGRKGVVPGADAVPGAAGRSDLEPPRTRRSPWRRDVYGTIPLARPVLGEAEEAAVLEVLRSGQLSLGPKLEEFERCLPRAWGRRVPVP